MSTLLFQDWCAARLSALCSINERMTAQAKSLMTEESTAVQPGVSLEAAIIHNVCCQHQRILASLARELSVSSGVGFTGDATCRKSVAGLASAQADQPMIRSFVRLCDLRATMAAAQFSCDELGGAVGVLGLSTNRDDLYWMRDECAAYNRRLETLVIFHQAQLVAPKPLPQRVRFEPGPLPHPSVAGQMAYFNVTPDQTVHEAC